MDFNNDNKPICSTVELTSTLAQEIYTASSGYSNPSKMFKAHVGEYDWSNINKVFAEAKEIVNQITTLKSGSFLLEEAVYTYDEETGERTTVSERVYYKPTTKTEFVTRLNSELLDCETVLTDYMNGSTWANFIKVDGE